MVAVIPSTPDPWEDILDERQQKHVDFCQNYVSRYGHGAPGHLDYTVIAALANLVQEQARQLAHLASRASEDADVNPDDRREQLAAYAHQAWAGWMKYLFSKCKHNALMDEYVMPRSVSDRWQRQMNTAYADLPESEKASDRDEADKMLAIVRGL